MSEVGSSNTVLTIRDLSIEYQTDRGVLKAMRRGYTREAYLDLVTRIRDTIPNVSLSSDFISGFCGETEEDHAATLSLLETVQYDHVRAFVRGAYTPSHTRPPGRPSCSRTACATQ